MSLVNEILGTDDFDDLMDRDPIFSVVSTESIKKLSPNKPITLTPETSLKEAIVTMQNKRIGCIVVTVQGSLKGIFTERDALFKILNKNVNLEEATLSEFMTPDPVALLASDKIAYALNKMTLGGFRHIPIVDENDVLEGIISVKDIVDYLANLVPEEVYNLRPQPMRLGFSQVEGG